MSDPLIKDRPEIALLTTFRIGLSANAKMIPENLNALHDATLFG